MAKKQTGKRFHLPLRAYLLYLALICFALTGVTFSGYVAVSYGDDGARVAKMGTVTVTENGVPYQSDVQWAVAPGADITKDAKINFSGSELACYVFFEVEVSGFEAGENGSYFYRGADGTTWLSWHFSTDWEPLAVNGKAVYYRIVAPNEQISESVIADGGKITVNPDITASELKNLPQLSISIKACAVQYGGFDDAEAAYLAVNPS